MVANLTHQTHSNQDVSDLDSRTESQAEATVDIDNELVIEHSTTVDSQAGSRQVLDAQLIANGKFVACLHKVKQEGNPTDSPAVSSFPHNHDAVPGSIHELYIQPAVKSYKSLNSESYRTIPLKRDYDSVVWSHGIPGTQSHSTVIGAVYSSVVSSVGVTIVRLPFEPTRKLRLPHTTPAIGEEQAAASASIRSDRV